MLPSLPLAISATPPALDASNPIIFLGLLIGGLLTLALLLNAVAGTIKVFRRNPPADDVFARKDYVDFQDSQLRTHLMDVEGRTDKRILQIHQERKESVGILHGKIDALKNTTEQGFRDLHRSIGRLEGPSHE